MILKHFYILGITSFETALLNFANPIIFLLLGGFIIAEGVTRCGLVNRIAYMVMAKIGNRPSLILFTTVFFSKSRATYRINLDWYFDGYGPIASQPNWLMDGP